MTSRRSFLKASAAFALIPLVNIPLAKAADKVPLTDPAAVGLKYTEDATTAERADKMGIPGSEQTCSNCQFFTPGENGWGGCALFQNRLVAERGWCLGWIVKK